MTYASELKNLDKNQTGNENFLTNAENETELPAEVPSTSFTERLDEEIEADLAELRAHLQAIISGALPGFYEFQQAGYNLLYPKKVDIDALQERVKTMQIPALIQPQHTLLEQAANAFLDRFRRFRKERDLHNNALEFIKFRLEVNKAGWDEPQNRDYHQALKHGNRLSGHLSGALDLMSLLNENVEWQTPWETTRQANYDVLLNELLPVNADAHNNQYAAQTRGNLTGKQPDNIKFNAIVDSVTLDERIAREALSTEIERLSARLLSGITLTRNYAEKPDETGETSGIKRDIDFLCQVLQSVIPVVQYAGQQIQPETYQPLRQKEARTTLETVTHELGKAWNAVEQKMQGAKATVQTLSDKGNKNKHRIGHALPGSTASDKNGDSHNINKAVFQVGIRLLDKIQQTTSDMHKAIQTSRPLQQAVSHYSELDEMLSGMPSNSILDAKLRAESGRWRQKAEESKKQLQHVLGTITTLSDESMKQRYLSARRGELNAVTKPLASNTIIRDFDTQVKATVEGLSDVQKALCQALLRLSAHGQAGGKELDKQTVSWLQQLKGIKDNLKTGITQATGQSINNFSPQGMLARYMAEWREAEKQRYLGTLSAEERAATEKHYDNVFFEVIQHYLPQLSKESDPQGEGLLQRLRLEVGNAAQGTTLYPATMADILAGMKSREQAIRDWSERKLIRGAFLAVCLGGFKLLPNLAAFPLRLPIKFAITGAKVAWGAHKGRQGIRGGEGDISGEIAEYAKQSYKTAAIKIVLSLPPGLATTLGIASIAWNVYEGGLKGAGEKVAEHIIGETPWRVLDTGSKAVAEAYVTTLIDAAITEEEIPRAIRERATDDVAPPSLFYNNNQNVGHPKSRKKRSFDLNGFSSDSGESVTPFFDYSFIKAPMPDRQGAQMPPYGSDNEISDNEISDNEIFDNEIFDNEISDNEISDNEIFDNEIFDNEISDNVTLESQRLDRRRKIEKLDAGFPSLQSLAAKTLQEKIALHTNNLVDPNKIMLIHFGGMMSNNHMLIRYKPIEAESHTLTDWLILNFSQHTRDYIGVDRNLWGFYSIDHQGKDYNTEINIGLTPKEFAEMVYGIDFYKNVYMPELDAYWNDPRNVKLEELKNVMVLGQVIQNSNLSDEGAKILLDGFGLQDNTRHPTYAYQFNINGYPATDMLMFVDSHTFKLVLYMPRVGRAIEFEHMDDIKNWVLSQCRDESGRAKILKHFPLEEIRDGLIYSGVETILNSFSDVNDGSYNKYLDGILDNAKIIDHPIIEFITQEQKKEMVGNADNLIKSDSEVTRDAWIEGLSAAGQIIPNPITPFISIALATEKAIDSDNNTELSKAKGQMISDGINIGLMVLTGGLDSALALPEEIIAAEAFNTTNVIKSKMSVFNDIESSIGQSKGGIENFNTAPVKVSQTEWHDVLGEEFHDLYEDYNGECYRYTDPVTKKEAYLIYDSGEKNYINIENNKEWQARHYDIEETHTWETGVDNQLYENIEKFEGSGGNVNSEKSDDIEYGILHGHYIPPVQVEELNGKLIIVNGYNRISVAKKLGIKKIPYKIITTKNPMKFMAEEMLMPSGRAESPDVKADIAYLKEVISTRLRNYTDFITNPMEQCEKAAKALVPFLKNIEGVSDVTVGNIGYWSKPFDPYGDIPLNHYVVFAKYNGNVLAFDLTAHQFSNLGIYAPIISTEDAWIQQMQAAFKTQPRTLVKFYKIEGGSIDGAKFAQSSLGPFDDVGNVFLLSKPDWYTDKVFRQTSQLRSNAEAANIKNRQEVIISGVGASKVILEKAHTQSGLDIYQKDVGRNFRLYQASESKTNALYLSAHGGYFRNTGDAKIPRGVNIDFLVGHGDILVDPGIEFINHEHWQSYAKINAQGYTLNDESLNSNPGQYHKPVATSGTDEGRLASGSEQVGYVKNYQLSKFTGNKNETGLETPERIAHAIDVNRAQKTGVKMDVLTVRNRFAANNMKLSDVLDLIEKNPDFNNYTRVVFSACRSDLGDNSLKTLGAKDIEVIILERTNHGWQVMLVPDAADKDKEQGLNSIGENLLEIIPASVEPAPFNNSTFE